MILQVLITAIIPPQIQSHPGTGIADSNLMIDTTAKMRSAAVSSWLPNSLTLFVFLAIVPSSISLKPQKRYRI